MLLAGASPCLAQTPPVSEPPPAKPADPAPAKTSNDTSKPAEQTVTVTGKASSLQTSIDRRSYNVANDLQKAVGGSVADVLRNVPAVQVDVQGNVSLRGSQSVTILIDGQPSALMKGQNRADVLQQMPADQIERVEVMTNPSAAFTPEGTGGIINLITKKSSKNTPTITGTIRASVDTKGHPGVSVSETYSVKGLTLTGNAGVRERGSRNSGYTDSTLTDPISGAVSHSRSTFDGQSTSKTGNAHAGIDYDLDSNTRLSAEASYFVGEFRQRIGETYTSDAASGASANDYTSTSTDTWRFNDASLSAGLVRKLPGDEHEISIRLNRDTFTGKSGQPQLFHYQDPSLADLYQGVSSRDQGTTTSLKAEYKGPLPGGAKLVTGYEYTLQQQNSDNETALGSSAANATTVAALTNAFKGSQGVHALYATYQRAFGPLTVMPGLRLEEALIDIDQVTQATKASQDYFRAYPTLHLSYKLDDNRQITASYSQRVQRPGLQSLNPFRVYNSPLSYSQGNPKLAPQTTDSYELGYEFRKKSTFYLATLFYRDNRKEFTSLQQDIGGGVILNTQANLGHSRQSGLELSANGDLLKTLSYTVSGTAAWQQIDPGNLALSNARSGTVVFGHGSLNWSPTKQDFFQANLYANGRRPNAQGYTGASMSLNLGYRHKFNDKWAFVGTLTDPFDTSRFTNVVDIPSLKQRGEFQNHQRALFLGFTYALGTAKTRASEGFDFNSGGGGK